MATPSWATPSWDTPSWATPQKIQKTLSITIGIAINEASILYAYPITRAEYSNVTTPVKMYLSLPVLPKPVKIFFTDKSGKGHGRVWKGMEKA